MSVPDTLYKYMSSGTATIVLRNQTLRWSSPGVFNDVSEFRRIPEFRPSLRAGLEELPREIVQIAQGKSSRDTTKLSEIPAWLVESTKLLLESGVSEAELVEEVAYKAGDADERHQELMQQFWDERNLQTARVLCVTANPINEVMWGNYADNHSGVVLGFRHVPAQDTPLQVARPIQYQDDLPSLGPGIDFLLYGETRELRERAVEAVCFTKKASWSYEAEWRVVTWRPEEGDANFGDYQFSRMELESITFGVRCPKDTVDELRALTKDKFPFCSHHQMDVMRGDLVRVSTE